MRTSPVCLRRQQDSEWTSQDHMTSPKASGRSAATTQMSEGRPGSSAEELKRTVESITPCSIRGLALSSLPPRMRTNLEGSMHAQAERAAQQSQQLQISSSARTFCLLLAEPVRRPVQLIHNVSARYSTSIQGEQSGSCCLVAPEIQKAVALADARQLVPYYLQVV